MDVLQSLVWALLLCNSSAAKHSDSHKVRTALILLLVMVGLAFFWILQNGLSSQCCSGIFSAIFYLYITLSAYRDLWPSAFTFLLHVRTFPLTLMLLFGRPACGLIRYVTLQKPMSSCVDKRGSRHL
jgi:hypothetical protein